MEKSPLSTLGVVEAGRETPAADRGRHDDLGDRRLSAGERSFLKMRPFGLKGTAEATDVTKDVGTTLGSRSELEATGAKLLAV